MAHVRDFHLHLLNLKIKSDAYKLDITSFICTKHRDQLSSQRFVHVHLITEKIFAYILLQNNIVDQLDLLLSQVLWKNLQFLDLIFNMDFFWVFLYLFHWLEDFWALHLVLLNVSISYECKARDRKGMFYHSICI
jgi:hypothetical protein